MKQKLKNARRTRKIGKAIVVCFLAVLLATITIFLSFRMEGGRLISAQLGSSVLKQNLISSLHLEDIHSTSAVLLDLETSSVLAEKKCEQKMYPASLTKIMTAILTLEQIDSLDQEIKMPEDIYPSLYAQNASMAGFQPGETVRLKDLVYGILLPSGAECCEVIARFISGSEASFVQLMNQKAKELGMARTHFSNSTGLHRKDHYSTVEDIAILLRYSLSNSIFREIFTSKKHVVPASEFHPEGFTFLNTMFSSMENITLTDGEFLGGKTGYTEEAGLCLASLARIAGKEYILVTAGAPGSHQTEPYHLLDAEMIYNQLSETG